jgi:hypothetical protein
VVVTESYPRLDWGCRPTGRSGSTKPLGPAVLEALGIRTRDFDGRNPAAGEKPPTIRMDPREEGCDRTINT